MNENLQLLENKMESMTEEGFAKKKSFFSSYYVHTATQAKLKKNYLYLNAEGKRVVQEAISNRNFAKIEKAPKVMTAGCRLEVWIATDNSACVMQLQEYVPHHYVPCSDVVVVKDDSVRSIKNFVNL